MHDLLQPWQPTRDDPWDFDAAAHLWRRAGFSAPTRDVEKTLKLAPAEAARRLVAGTESDPATDELEAIYRAVLGSGNADNARAWLMTRMVRSRHQLREKMALFWHGHFATSIRKVNDLSWMMRQYRLFLRFGLGPFGELLNRVTRDPAMIRWLDNETNTKGQANENYARELFELFTLGEGNYTEKDIQEAARAFTGWHILNDRYHFSETLHDDGEKAVLGQTGRFGGEDVCRIALAQEACGRFLAGKLLRFFVHPEPAADVVDAFGKELKAGGYDLARALATLFSSRLFYAQGNRRALIKSPLEYVIGAVRVFETRFHATAAVPVVRAMGQDLLAPPNVKGWPGHRDWINTATWLTRVNAARRLAGSFEPSRGLDYYSRALLGRPLPASERSRLEKDATGKRDLVHALLSLPEAHLA